MDEDMVCRAIHRASYQSSDILLQSSYPSSQVPTDVNPLFDSIGMGRLNPYSHIQPGMVYSASSYDSSDTRAPSSFPQSLHPVANTVHDQGWPKGHGLTQPFHSSQLPAYNKSNSMAGAYPLPSGQAAQVPVSPINPSLPGNTTSPFAPSQVGSTYQSLGHVSAPQLTSSSIGASLPHVDETSATPATKANKAGTWTAGHTTAVIGRITSSQELYNQIMTTSRSLRNVEQANRVWGTVSYYTCFLRTSLIIVLLQFTAELFPGHIFTPAYVGRQWWSAVETAYDLADFADDADDALRSNVEEFTKYVRSKVLERLEASNGVISRFKSKNVSIWFDDPTNGWFARFWARYVRPRPIVGC
jgi:hypothetical protein